MGGVTTAGVAVAPPGVVGPGVPTCAEANENAAVSAAAETILSPIMRASVGGTASSKWRTLQRAYCLRT
jgi:hypothetical protein